MSIFSKVLEATEAKLDSMIEKSKSAPADEGMERKGIIDLSYPEDEQYGYKERPGMVGAQILKSMGRKDSVIRSIISTRLAQVKPFTKPQQDKYTEGWIVEPVEPADLSEEDKMKLADPTLDDETYKALKYEMDQKLSKMKMKQDKEMKEVAEFVQHSGMSSEETDTTHKRWDLDKMVASIVEDRLTYNYIAIELIPTKDGSKLHHYYPMSAGTIKYVSARAAAQYQKLLQQETLRRDAMKKRFDASKPLKYVQVVRGRIVAAFTEDELIFEPATPTVDPEDNGYAPGELEYLINIVTAHLYAEAHNRNFFTQGIGTKGILHIKGNNLSRAQLEAFKRQWFNQVVNTRNAFRPPIIGMADDVKWVPLAQTNREMEFEAWMNYLIKICCAIYQIDPAEINFDISKVQTSTLQEGNNEEKLKNSRDKGLRPLLDMIESIINNHIVRYWNPDYAKKYKFKFVGFKAESRSQEIDRLQKEVMVYKTLNEARIEMGKAPLEKGDVVLNATYTQYLSQLQQQEQAAQGQMGPEGDPNAQGDGQGSETDQGMSSDMQDLSSALDEAVGEAADQADKDSKQAAQDEKDKAKVDATKKSQASVIEYYLKKE